MSLVTFSDVDISKTALKGSDPVLFKDVPVGVFVCNWCQHRGEIPKMRCVCLGVFYCNGKCQDSDWEKHRLVCPKAKEEEKR